MLGFTVMIVNYLLKMFFCLISSKTNKKLNLIVNDSLTINVRHLNNLTIKSPSSLQTSHTNPAKKMSRSPSKIHNIIDEILIAYL